MRERWYYFMQLMIALLVLAMITTGCSKAEERWVYRPMVSIGDNLFGDTGYTKERLLEGWVNIGEIEQEIPQYEPMTKGTANIVSNMFPVGTKIFGNPEEPEKIYVQYNQKYIRFELIENDQ